MRVEYGIETWFSDTVKPDFPGRIETVDPERVGKAYLLLTNPNESLSSGTKNKKADDLIVDFKKKGISGLTLADYLIEEKNILKKLKSTSWIGGRTITRGSLPHEIALPAGWMRWHPDAHRVDVYSSPSDRSNSHLGARSSVVLALEPLP